MSPANVPPTSSAPQNLDPSSAAVNKVRRRVAGSNAGSDTDNVLSDRDGGAMSDASRARQRLKLKMSASPPPKTGGTSTPQPSSRAATPPPPLSPQELPSEEEIRGAIPSEGIPIKELMKLVAHPRNQRKAFVALVKSVAEFDKAKGLLYPK